jgi:hypothetical protein
MPNNEISKKVSAAKTALAHANQMFPSPAPAPAAPPAPMAAPSAPQQMPNPSLADELGAKFGMMKKAGQALGTFKKGGKVPMTGKYILHKGETVVPTRKSVQKSRESKSGARILANARAKRLRNSMSGARAVASRPGVAGSQGASTSSTQEGS